MELFGDRRSTEQRAPLEDQRLEPGLGEVRAVGQPVVAATDDDRVVGPVGGLGGLGRRFRLRFRWRLRHVRPSSDVGCRGDSRRPRGDVLIAVVHVDLQSDGRARRGKGRPDAGEGDVALQHRRVHVARGVADLDAVIVVQKHLAQDRRVVLGRDQPGLAVDPVIVGPVDDQAGQPPARRLVGQFALDRTAADERAIVAGQVADHPAPAELDQRGTVFVGPAVATGREVDVEQQQPGFDAEQVQRVEPERQDTETGHGCPQRVPDLERVLAANPDS